MRIFGILIPTVWKPCVR
ncbi:TPR repeat family protein, partial [Chlamydia psittaci 08-2626_L3]